MPSLINARRLRWAQIAASSDFSGGPNARDQPIELAANEAVDSWNCSYDERGGVAERLGYAKQNGTPFSGGVVQNIYWSPALAARITQAGSSIYLADTNTARHTFTTAELVTFTELNALVVACHPTDGLFTSPDGVTWTAVADPDAPKGTCVAAAQSKVFVGRPDGSVHWCVLADPTSWVATDFNKLWEKDQQPIVALHGAPGQDITGAPGLLAFKQESAYRIDDFTTGAYTTVDATVGAAGARAVIGDGARVYALSRKGVFWWENGTVGMTDATDQFRPLWSSLQLNLSKLALWAAGRKSNRLVFSLTRVGSTANDLELELHPAQGSVAPRSSAMSCYATATGGSDTVYGGSPTVTGQVYQLDVGGTDDGAPIAWRFQTRWFNLAAGFKVSIWQARAHMRGKGTLTVLKDFATSGTDRPFDLTEPPLLYDSGLTYDAGLTYPAGGATQKPARFFSIGSCTQVSFKFSGSSSGTVTGAPLLGGNVGPTLGSWALYGIELAYWWLGFDS